MVRRVSWIETRNSITLAIIISLVVGVFALAYWSIITIGVFQQFVIGNTMGLAIQLLGFVTGLLIFLSIVDKSNFIILYIGLSIIQFPNWSNFIFCIFIANK